MLNKKKKHALEKVGHYLTGFVVIVKGYDKLEHFDEHPFIPVLLLAIGIFIMLATFFHHWFEARIKEFKTLLFSCEALALLMVSYYYFSSGRNLLPLIYLLCSITYFILAIVFYRKKVKSQSIKEIS